MEPGSRVIFKITGGDYADLDPGGRPGLGARAHAEFGIPVIGVPRGVRLRVAMPAGTLGRELNAGVADEA